MHAAGAGDILQQIQPAAVVSLLQQLQHLSTAVAGASGTNTISSPASSNVYSASVAVSSHAACSSTSSSGSSRYAMPAMGQRQANLLGQRNASYLSMSPAAAAAAAAGHGQQQQQQWRGLADLALNLQAMQGKQQRQLKQPQSGYSHVVPTEFEREVLATASVDKLAALVSFHSLPLICCPPSRPDCIS